MASGFDSIKRVIGNPKFGILAVLGVSAAYAFYKQTDPISALSGLAISIAAAVLAEWAFFGRVPGSSIQSATITGAIVGMLLAPSASPTLFWFAPVAAIASKRLLQLGKRRHIFNPATAGLILTAFLLGNRINWWGFSSPYWIVLGAGAVLFRMNRLSLPFAYIFGRGISALIVSGLNLGLKAFALPNLFFAFVMLVEPKTSPGKRPQQWLFGFVGGILATILFAFYSEMDGDLLALLLLNLVYLLMNRINTGSVRPA